MKAQTKRRARFLGRRWQNGIIALEIDHIDGDNTNNEISNLRYLCPNCHALTDTYRGKNIKPKIECREHTLAT